MISVESNTASSPTLFERFFIATEIVAELLSNAPHAVCFKQLEGATGRSVNELMILCSDMEYAGLLRRDPFAFDRWTLTCDADTVTLEDVFRCLLFEQRTAATPVEGACNAECAPPNDVHLLIMQAMIAINQSVFRHLREYALNRHKIGAAGMPPLHRQRHHAFILDNVFEFATSGC